MNDQTLPPDNPTQVPGQPATSSPVERRKPSLFIQAALAMALIALLIVAWQWIQTRHSVKQLEKALAERLEDFNGVNQQSLALAKNADDRSSSAIARASLLEQKLAESMDQQEALQTLYTELANNQEERVISEVEQLLVIANQQLQLAGNIKPALLALQTADTRLQKLDAPMAVQLRKVLGQDIQRLQSLPLVDIAGMSLKLGSLTNTIDTLPLVSDRHPSEKKPLEHQSTSSTWQRLLEEVWQDVKSMIRVERIDRPEPPLLAPDQTFFLRENIKLHLLTARIALLQHDEATYKADLAAAEKWLKGNFDVREPDTQQALATIRQLSADSIVIQLPDISESLVLASKYKLTLERSSSIQSEPAGTPAKRNSGKRIASPPAANAGNPKPVETSGQAR